VALRPASAAQVLIYGNNLLRNDYPYTRMACCHLELGEWDAAEAQLTRGQAQHEPSKERESLVHCLREAQAMRVPKEPVHPSAMQIESPSPKPESLPAPTHSVDPGPSPQSQAPTVLPAEAKPAEPAPPAERSVPRAIPPKGAETRPAESAPGSKLAVPPASPAAPAKSSRSWWPWLLLALPVLALLWRRRSAVAPSGEFSEPDRVGPYRVERLLGRGGFASTYLAHHEGTGQRVALKRLHPYRLDDPEFLGRFRQEAQLGSRLVHPHLVRLVDPGPSDGSPWLAMEYIEGRRLDEYLKSAGPLPPEEVLSLARGMADGLTYAHAQGVVHRDLKPANILMAEGGVKIMDFGIARVMDAETLTTTYAFLGTPRYAAPEAQLKTTIGPAADWYSFGIILFELLSGRPPFQGETPFEILDRHRAEPLPDLRLLRPGLPASLVELVEALCAKDPEARPRDAEVLRCLAEAQAQNTRSSAT
jgi:hypothetical protein